MLRAPHHPFKTHATLFLSSSPITWRKSFILLRCKYKMHIKKGSNRGYVVLVLFYLASCFSSWAIYFSRSKSGLSISTIKGGRWETWQWTHGYESRTWYNINNSNWVLLGSISAFCLFNQLLLMLVFELSFLFFSLLLQRCIVRKTIYKTESESGPTTNLTSMSNMSI